MTVVRFMGCMYLEEPVKICSTTILFALSEGWNASQNATISLFGHKLDKTVHRPIPLYGPCPQHATFDVTNPAKIIHPPHHFTPTYIIYIYIFIYN